MPHSRSIKDPRRGIRVNISGPAEKQIGPRDVNEFVKVLMDMMDALGVEWGYVSKRGSGLEITIHRVDGWAGVMKVRP